MKIGLNGQKLLQEKPGGTEKYILEIFSNLAKIDHENEYIIYFIKKPSNKKWEEISQGNKNFSYKVIPYSKIPGISWTQMKLAIELLGNKVDVFFSPIHTIPGFPALLLKKTKFVTTIHDLGYKNTKELKGKPIKKFLVPLELSFIFNFSNALLAPSNFTKTQILNTGLGAKEKKIFVTYEGVSEEFEKASETKVEKVKNKYSLENNYLFFLSTIQPRKNIPNLIRGFAKAIKDNPELKKTKLAIAGKKGWQYQKVFDLPEELKISKNVIFLGRIPDEDRAPLLTGAKAYVNPSMEEGFGLPVLEAMACETPCILSDIPPFREIAQNYANYFDPLNVDSIAWIIAESLKSEINKDNIKEAKKRTREFTWEKAAQKTLDAFYHVKKNC